MGILIIAEDDQDTRDMYALQAETALGARVIAVDSGEALVAACLSHGPDAVIADYGLNGLNGADATKAIRANYPKIPVYIVSGSDVKKQSLEAGATEFFKKPNGIEFVIEKLSRMKEFAAGLVIASAASYFQANHL